MNPVIQRRRGEALETALLAAAWQELIENGYEAFTMDGVAHRAGTSRPVLYRRWSGKVALVRAAMAHGLTSAPIAVPDTGSVRGDLIELMKRANEARSGIVAVLSLQLSGIYRDTGASLADIRTEALGDRLTATEKIVARGVERGEIDPARLTPRVIALPFDLYRHELLMTLKPVGIAAIEEIVDDIFLPLVRRTST